MQQATNWRELAEAIGFGEKTVEITSDFEIESTINVSFPVTVRSEKAKSHTLVRGAGLFKPMFAVLSVGCLSLENIAIDGNKKESYEREVGPISSLIEVSGGLKLSGVTLANAASSDGAGAIRALGVGAQCTLENSVIKNCETSGGGGGIKLNDFAALVAKNTEFTGNAAEDGGAVWAGENTGVVIKDCVMRSNTAELCGGAVHITGKGSILTASKCVIEKNYAGKSGGGVFVGSGAEASIESCDVNENISDKCGGGVAAKSRVDLTLLEIDDSTVAKNSSGSGGGVFAGSAVAVSIENAIINENEAQLGAGLYLSSRKSVRLADCVLLKNKAQREGGGLSLRCSEDQMLRSIIAEQNVARRGGGIFISSIGGRAKVDFEECAICANNALSGGGIAVYSAECVIGAQTIAADNTAKDAGGGIYLNSGSLLRIMPSGEIKNNFVGSGSGGGVFASCHVEGAECGITGNKAKENGGGIYIDSAGGAVFKNAEIENNQAVNGGGICVSPEGSLRISDGSISGNKAFASGGGIYIFPTAYALLSGALAMYDNKSLKGSDVFNLGTLAASGALSAPGGVYIAAQENVIKVEASIRGGNIQLENSPYIFPSQEFSSITAAEAAEAYPKLTAEDENAFLKPNQGFDDWVVRRNESADRVVLSYSEKFRQNLRMAVKNLDSPGTLETAPLEVSGEESPGGNLSPGQNPLYSRREHFTKDFHILHYCPNDLCGTRAVGVAGQVKFFSGENIALSLSVPERRGYIFTGWSVKADGTEGRYAPGQRLKSGLEDIFLYAQWKRRR